MVEIKGGSGEGQESEDDKKGFKGARPARFGVRGMKCRHFGLGRLLIHNGNLRRMIIVNMPSLRRLLYVYGNVLRLEGT